MNDERQPTPTKHELDSIANMSCSLLIVEDQLGQGQQHRPPMAPSLEVWALRPQNRPQSEE